MPVKSTNTRISIDHIAKGPACIEAILDAHLRDQGSPPTQPLIRILQYIELLKSPSIFEVNDTSHIQNFLLGYFHDQAFLHAIDKNNAHGILEKSLIYYRGSMTGKGALSFYAQWRIGAILQSLDHPWPEAEEAYLNAYESAPIRAESLAAITKHYINANESAIGYIFSSFSKDNHYNKIPSPPPKWGLEINLYNWKVLDLHTAVCCQLGEIDEAWETFSLLLQKSTQSPEQFQPKELEGIQRKLKLLQSSLHPC